MSNRESKRPLPVVFGCAGEALTSIERGLFEKANPFGLILFQRNCQNPTQVRWLIKEFRRAVDRDDAPIFIDQEGGRVARLQPPNWPRYPAARLFGAIYEEDPEWGAEAMRLYARLVASDLWKLGITVNCAPVVDLFVQGASNAIGDRAMSRKPTAVAALARVLAETFLANGVLPVVKHIPGHGRLNVDPHMVLPVINATRAELESEDFVPFELLKDLPLAMNSHAVFTAIDNAAPASMSAKLHKDIIREMIGFDGLLLSDDIVMKALSGTPAERAKGALAAGSDIILHCNGVATEMEEIVEVLSPMGEESWACWQRAKDMVKDPPETYDPTADSKRLDILLGAVAFQVKSVG